MADNLLRNTDCYTQLLSTIVIVQKVHNVFSVLKANVSHTTDL